MKKPSLSLIVYPAFVNLQDVIHLTTKLNNFTIFRCITSFILQLFYRSISCLLTPFYSLKGAALPVLVRKLSPLVPVPNSFWEARGVCRAFIFLTFIFITFVTLSIEVIAGTELVEVVEMSKCNSFALNPVNPVNPIKTFKKTDSLRHVIKTAKHDTTMINSLFELVNEFYLSNPDTAIIICKDALYKSEKIYYKKGLSEGFAWFGFNGQEKDDEIAGVTGSHYEFKFREYDSRIGRFWSVDPLTDKYPYWSPFAFAGNTPIMAIDLEGLEPYKPNPNIGETKINVLNARNLKIWPVNSPTASEDSKFYNDRLGITNIFVTDFRNLSGGKGQTFAVLATPEELSHPVYKDVVENTSFNIDRSNIGKSGTISVPASSTNATIIFGYTELNSEPNTYKATVSDDKGKIISTKNYSGNGSASFDVPPGGNVKFDVKYDSKSTTDDFNVSGTITTTKKEEVK